MEMAEWERPASHGSHRNGNTSNMGWEWYVNENKMDGDGNGN